MKDSKTGITIRTVDINIKYNILNISSREVYNASQVAGSGYEDDTFSSAFDLKKGDAGALNDMKVVVNVNIDYAMSDNINKVNNNENVMLVVDDVQKEAGEKIEPAGRAELPGQTASIEHAHMAKKNLVQHELGHDMGLEHVEGNGNNLMNPVPTTNKLTPKQIRQMYSGFGGMKDGSYHMGARNAQSEAKNFVQTHSLIDDKKRQKKQVFNIVLLFGLLLSGCESPLDSGNKELRLKMFTCKADLIDGIQLISQSDDGYIGSLLLKGADTIYFNFGYGIDNLSEKDPEVVYYPYDEDSIRNKLDTNLVDVNRIVYTKKANFDIDEFRKQNVEYTTISGYRAKITFPREISKGGITGMYIDSLRKDAGGRLKYNFYAKDLDSLCNQALLKLFKSVKFSFE